MSVPTPIFSDSESTIKTAHSSQSLKKSLHIRRRILYMLEARDDGEIEFYSCAGKTNPANVFTKWVQLGELLAARKYFMNYY